MRRLLFCVAVPVVLIGLSACAEQGAPAASSSVPESSSIAELQLGPGSLTTVMTTSFVAPTADTPDRAVVQDAGVDDCLLSVAEAEAFAGGAIDTVQTYRQPYIDGTSSDYCLYGGNGTALVQVEMFTTVRQSAADLVAANTTTPIPAAAPAGWNTASDGVNVRILFVDGQLLGSISSLAATVAPSGEQLQAVVAAATGMVVVTSNGR